jgi:glycosyltransferase involved in cell wall biosynthesis
MSIDGKTLAVVIPAFNAEATIQAVIAAIPACVDRIVIVNDASVDDTRARIAKSLDPRIILIDHDRNQGVGGAMVTGFKEALELKSELIAKIDADGQMDPRYLDRFARVAIHHRCDYVKANRFGHLEALPAMPRVRLAGNLIMTFLTKFASGYWNVFDPQNGYVLITRTMLKRLDLERIDRSYFFENSMLINLNIVRARIGEIYLPAQYNREQSSMVIRRILLAFPGKLLRGFGYRIYHKYVFRSLSPFALLFLFGLLALSWGSAWGAFAWWNSYATGIAATTGTVILSLLPLLVGWTSLLQAVVLDVESAGDSLLFDYDDESLQGPG